MLASTLFELRVGTCGWSYQDWVGPFYPEGSRSGDMLGLYASVFDTVEVNSTFYAVPPKERVERWAEVTPEGFQFCVKAPSAFTHDARLRLDEGGAVLDAFVGAVEPLGEKLDRVLVQLPPSLTAQKGVGRLARLVEQEPFSVPWVLEARHASWAREDVFGLLEDNGVTWAWSENDAWRSTARLTTGEAYVRLIGDRSLEVFDRLQREMGSTIGAWASRLEDHAEQVDTVRVFANNHFAGFGPGTVNRVLDRFGHNPRGWTSLRGKGQATLEEYESSKDEP